MTGDLGRLVELGGPVVVILLVASALGLAVVMFKWWQLAVVRDSRLDRIGAGLDLWCQGRHADGIALLRGSRIGYAADLEFALTRLVHVDREQLRDELGRRACNFADRFAGLMRPLELLYYLAPLLGLLGTVLGMIEAFRELQAAAGDAAHVGLAGGIWEALLTTAVGLAVALPFALLHAHLQARLERLHARLDDFALRVLSIPLYAATGGNGDG
jgi:biopolymer transport protein ExbB